MCIQVCVCVHPCSVYKARKPLPFPMGLRIVETAIILLSFGFLLSLHIALCLSSQRPHRSFCILLSIYMLMPPFLLSSALSLYCCSPAVVRCFMGCLLKRRSITDALFSHVSSSLPPWSTGNHRCTAFPSLSLFYCMI